MTTSLKVILAVMGIAALASPVMAQSEITRPYVEQPTDDISSAHKAVSHTHHPREPAGRRGGHNPL
jgi:hypothetical protein